MQPKTSNNDFLCHKIFITAFDYLLHVKNPLCGILTNFIM